MIEIKSYQRATSTYSGVITDANGDPVVLASDDYLRIKIGRRGGATPDLDLVSGAGTATATPTANGSSLQIDDLGSSSAGASYTLTLAEGDMTALLTAPYGSELFVVDNSVTNPADAMVPADRGVLHVLPGLAGDTGVPS